MRCLPPSPSRNKGRYTYPKAALVSHVSQIPAAVQDRLKFGPESSVPCVGHAVRRTFQVLQVNEMGWDRRFHQRPVSQTRRIVELREGRSRSGSRWLSGVIKEPWFALPDDPRLRGHADIHFVPCTSPLVSGVRVLSRTMEHTICSRAGTSRCRARARRREPPSPLLRACFEPACESQWQPPQRTARTGGQDCGEGC